MHLQFKQKKIYNYEFIENENNKKKRMVRFYSDFKKTLKKKFGPSWSSHTHAVSQIIIQMKTNQICV